MKFLKIFIIIVISFCFSAKSYSDIDIEAKHVIIQDHYSGKILFEKDADHMEK